MVVAFFNIYIFLYHHQYKWDTYIQNVKGKVEN